MKKNNVAALLPVFVLALQIIVSCSKVPSAIIEPEKTITDTIMVAENFEWEEKSEYSNAMLNLQSGQWIVANALLGTASEDRKQGTQALRVIGNGSANMAYSVNLGSETKIKVYAALYGNSAASRWVLLASNNGGSYAKVGDTMTTKSTALDSVVFSYNKKGWTSFAIQKVDAVGTINFDNFSITTKTPTFSPYYIAPPAYVTYYNTTPSIPVVPGNVGKDSLLYPLTGDNSSLLLGNPSNAVMNETATNNYLLLSRYYASSYSKDRGGPNWVAWHLDKTNYGAVSRTDNYQSNTGLPSGWYQVTYSSYNGSGYSRGHNCPSGDRTSSKEANYAVFLMSNIIPQASNNNNLVWNNLENYTRSLADAGNECYVFMGSYGNKGTIDNGKIVIPTNIWKVIVVLPNGNGDVGRIDANTRVICVNTPNSEDVNADWKTYRVSLQSIETATGLNLLSSLSAVVKQAVLNKIDNQ